MVQLFQFALQQNGKGIEHQFHQTVDKNHGRVEIRRHCPIMGKTEYLDGAEQWKGLQSIGMVESERRVKNKITVEQRYYLMSI